MPRNPGFPEPVSPRKAKLEARLYALPMDLLRKVTTGELTLDQAEAQALARTRT